MIAKVILKNDINYDFGFDIVQSYNDQFIFYKYDHGTPVAYRSFFKDQIKTIIIDM